jgi:DNA-binding MarR family transcriptional regulator
MSFQKLREASVYRQSLLPFVVSLQDHDILIAIGEAGELNTLLGYKQLSLLRLASPTTLQRRLKSLLGKKLIEKKSFRDDGRRVSYSLSHTTLLAYEKYIAHVLKG